MKISKDSLIFMKGVGEGNVFLLFDTTVVGELASLTSVNSDSSRLWNFQIVANKVWMS